MSGVARHPHALLRACCYMRVGDDAGEAGMGDKRARISGRIRRGYGEGAEPPQTRVVGAVVLQSASASTSAFFRRRADVS